MFECWILYVMGFFWILLLFSYLFLDFNIHCLVTFMHFSKIQFCYSRMHWVYKLDKFCISQVFWSVNNSDQSMDYGSIINFAICFVRSCSSTEIYRLYIICIFSIYILIVQYIMGILTYRLLSSYWITVI